MWNNRNVWIVLIGEFVAGLGMWMSIIANLEFMQLHVPSDFVKSLILFTGLLSGVAFSPLAGRVIDSFSKKRVLLYSSLARMLSVGIMFAALQQESILWMIVFFVVLQASAAFYFPALQSVIPLIVEEKDLLTLNGIHMNAGTIARIVGTTLAGLMLTVMTLYQLYTLAIIAYGLLFASTFLLQIREGSSSHGTAEAGEANGGEKQIGDADTPVLDLEAKRGFKAIVPLLREAPAVMTVLLLTVVPMLFIGGFNLMIINISELQHDNGVKSWLYAVEGTSIIVTGFLLRWFTRGDALLGRLFLFSLFVGGGELLLLYAEERILSLLAFGLFGFAIGGFYPSAQTLFQSQIPKAYHGRFFSFRSMLDRVMFQVALLATGLLLDTIGLQQMALGYGVFSVVLIGWLAFREAKRGRNAKASGKDAHRASL